MELKSTVNPYDYLRISRNSDGSIKRLFEHPTTAAALDPSPNFPVLTQDFPLNPKHATWVRVFLPRSPENELIVKKLPVVVYIHGGGFVFLSAGSTSFHDLCSEMAFHLPAVVVSVEHRLAPEHRLPAAYDDAFDALRWLRKTPHEWIRNRSDPSKCFLMGTSAGGNVAYHVGLRTITTTGSDYAFDPVRIRGLVLHHPFFGGSRRTGSETRLVDDPVLPLSAADLLWELALPVGADRDHVYCNPMSEKGSCRFGKTKEQGSRVLMVGGGGDPLVDRQKEAVKMLEEEGVLVEAVFTEGDCHGAEILDPTKAKALFGVVQNFIYELRVEDTI